MEYLKQANYDIRCEWGIHGVEALRDDSDVVIIVDVLSFSTSVDIALSREAIVYPYAGSLDNVANFAQDRNAILALKRTADDAGFTLSPTSLQKLPLGVRVVLPSPNGSTLSTTTGNVYTIAGCLRNARAVAQKAQVLGQRITVIPAGERWYYGTAHGALRPSLEDWIGAGAILSYLRGNLSPEAQTAQIVYEGHRDKLQTILSTCISGVELISHGYTNDVILASDLNSSQHVPILMDGAYQPITRFH